MVAAVLVLLPEVVASVHSVAAAVAEAVSRRMFGRVVVSRRGSTTVARPRPRWAAARLSVRTARRRILERSGHLRIRRSCFCIFSRRRA